MRGLSPPWSLFAVPNVTVYPSTASVPITALLYNGPLLCGFNVAITALIYELSDLFLEVFTSLADDHDEQYDKNDDDDDWDDEQREQVVAVFHRRWTVRHALTVELARRTRVAHVANWTRFVWTWSAICRTINTPFIVVANVAPTFLGESRPTALRSPYVAANPSRGLSAVCLWRCSILPRGLNFSEIFFHHLIACWLGQFY